MNERKEQPEPRPKDEQSSAHEEARRRVAEAWGLRGKSDGPRQGAGTYRNRSMNTNPGQVKP